MMKCVVIHHPVQPVETAYDKRCCDYHQVQTLETAYDERCCDYYQVQTLETAYDERCCDISPSTNCGDCIMIKGVVIITKCKL